MSWKGRHPIVELSEQIYEKGGRRMEQGFHHAEPYHNDLLIAGARVKG